MKKHALTQEFTPQQLNGITDWFSDAVEYASDKISDAALWATEQTGTTSDALAFTNEIDLQLGKLSAGFKAKVDEFRTSMAKLFDTQNKVDEAIESMPEGPDKERLMSKRAESRGIFSQYVVPAWNQFQQWIGGEGAYSGMGFVVTGTMIATAGAVVAVISVALPYIYSSERIEMAILNDPALAKTYVASRGSFFNLGPVPKYALIGAIGIGGIYFLSSLKNLTK